MWTTLSSRARRFPPGVISLALTVCLPALPAAQQVVAPDAPRPARVQPKPRPPTSTYEIKRPVQLRAVTVGRLTSRMRELAGAEFVKAARDPLFIEVKTAAGALGKPAMSAAPVILLNGERLLNTRAAGRDTLVAFLPDHERIRDENTVAVVWLGKQEPTLTRRPLTFRRADIKE